MAELDKILQKAVLDFNFDSLTSIKVGELIQNGDLAVQISEDFKKKFGNDIKPQKNSVFLSDYDKITKFLLESKLGSDLNMLLKPYSISVENVFIEKAHFKNKQNLLLHSVVERDTSQIPDQILDCMIWIKLKKNR